MTMEVKPGMTKGVNPGITSLIPSQGPSSRAEAKPTFSCHLERRPKAAVERSTPRATPQTPQSQKDRPEPSPNLS